MSEWIKHLADRIKEVDHAAAIKLNAEAHRKGILGTKGPEFYRDTVAALQRDVKGIEDHLKEDITNFSMRVAETMEKWQLSHVRHVPTFRLHCS